MSDIKYVGRFQIQYDSNMFCQESKENKENPGQICFFKARMMAMLT